MAELLITSSLDPVQERDIFPKGTGLPRHVTIWQYFDMPDEHLNEFIAETGNVVEAFPPLHIEGAQNDYFGPNNDVLVRRVNVLGKSATLLTLHSVLGAVIEKHKGEVRNPEWAYQGYNPHITYKDGRALNEGERTFLTTVELIEKEAATQNKIVRKLWKLDEL